MVYAGLPKDIPELSENGRVSDGRAISESHIQGTFIKEPVYEEDVCEKSVSTGDPLGKSNNRNIFGSLGEIDIDNEKKRESNEQETSPKPPKGLARPSVEVGESRQDQTSLLGTSLLRPQRSWNDELSLKSGILHRLELKNEEIRVRDKEIRRRDREIAWLNEILGKRSDKLDALRDQLEEQENRFRLAQQGSFRSMEKEKWVTREDGSIRSDLAKFERDLRSWARKFANADLSIFQQASIESKEKLITALRGSVRENDLRSPSWIFGDKLKDKGCLLLTHALLASYVVMNVFESPFYFFQDEMARLDGVTLNNEQAVKGEGGFGRNLTALYMEMNAVNMPQAQVWRSETLRLLNTTNNRGSNATSSIKSRIEDMRKRSCEALSSEFLNGPVELLIRPDLSDEEFEKMKRELRNIIFNAGEVSAHIWTQRTVIDARGLRRCGNFKINDSVVTAHRLHQLDDDDHRLDGKPIIAVIQPAIIAWGDNEGGNYDKYKVWSKAVVLVDDSWEDRYEGS